MHQIMDHRRRMNWSELPPELLTMIGNRLDAPMDLLGFRSVCSSWRSSTSPRSNQSGGTADDLLSPPKFPCPFASGRDTFLSENTIYRFQPVHEGNDDDEPGPPGSSSVPAKAWLVKVEVKKPYKYPLSSTSQVDDSPSPVPKVLSTLDYRMVKLGHYNRLDYHSVHYYMIGVSKVIRYPDTASISAQDCSIFVIYDGGKLGFAKRGDEEITIVDPGVSDYDDLIVHRGLPHVVDGRGMVSWIDYSSLKLTQISPTPFHSGARKHLVESGGELYVVDRYFETVEQWLAAAAAKAAATAEAEAAAAEATPSDEQATRRRRRYRYYMPLSRPRPRPRRTNNTSMRGRLPSGKTVDFKVYKLDHACGTWGEAKDLGDEAFFLSDDISFSASASEFEGCKKNCIYFKDQGESSLFSHAGNGLVFSLEDQSIQMFRWPRRLCFSNSRLNRRLRILDCSIKPPNESPN